MKSGVLAAFFVQECEEREFFYSCKKSFVRKRGSNIVRFLIYA